MISVIIPVYNTEDYLDECIRSVVDQTYQELEIIIINDGSTDGSGIICKKWAGLDRRIIYIEKENEGQGTARNLGLRLMTGEYVIFVDSDDYLDETLINSVYECIIAQEADICVYSHNGVDKEGNIYVNPLLFKTLNGTSIRENKEVLGCMTPILWNKMFSSALIKSISCGMSNCMCEDLVFNARLYRNAKRICMLDAPFYFYRYNRNGNMATNYERYMEIKNSIYDLNHVFEEAELFAEYWIPLYEISMVILKDFLLRLSKRTDMGIPMRIKQRFYDFWRTYKECLNKCFFQYLDMASQEKRYLLVGSYNLRIILHCFLLDEGLLKEDYSYSSIISFMSKNLDERISLEKYSFQNPYRKKCVEQDIYKYFYHNAKIQDIDYIVMDFLDEIWDVIRLKEHHYITCSPFLKELNISGLQEYERVSFLCEERRELFKDYLNCFMKKIRQSDARVVLVKHFLCEKHSMYYDVFTEYNDLEEIRKINQELEWYYQFFETCYPEILVVDALEFQGLVFTYDDFPFGCEPFYYNGGYYQRMAVQIGRCISGKV